MDVTFIHSIAWEWQMYAQNMMDKALISCATFLIGKARVLLSRYLAIQQAGYDFGLLSFLGKP